MTRSIRLLIAAALLAGCHDTRDAIDAMNRQTAAARLDAARRLAEQFQTQPNLLEQGDIQLFISSRLLGEALHLLDGLDIPVPGANDVTVRVVSMAPSLSAGVAAIDMKLQVARGGLKLDAVGTATLLPQALRPPAVEIGMRRQDIRFGPLAMALDLPEVTSIKPLPLRFKLVVERLAPRAAWGPFSADIKGFVAEFARLKLNDVLQEQLPEIEVPMKNLIQVNQPAQRREFDLSDGAYTAELVTPPVSWATGFSLESVVVLPRGIHLIGKLSDPGAVR